jgi:hypothetical protein
MSGINLSDADRELFREAMRLEGYDTALTSWMKAVCRVHARQLIDGTKDSVILDAIKRVETRIDIAEQNLTSEISDVGAAVDALKS